MPVSSARFSNALFVLCSALTLPACLAATGTESSYDPGLVGSEDGRYDFGPAIDLHEDEAGAHYADDFEPGYGHDYDLGPAVDLGYEGAAANFRPGFEVAYSRARDRRLQGVEADCGCVFPSSDPEVEVATICGEAVCVEERTYVCTYEGLAATIGTCVGAGDGAFDLTDYDFPEDDDAQPSSCQGDAGTCSGDDALSCQAKAGCTFMPSGECVGAPVPCSSRNQAACTTLGEGCFHVSPF